ARRDFGRRFLGARLARTSLSPRRGAAWYAGARGDSRRGSALEPARREAPRLRSASCGSIRIAAGLPTGSASHPARSASRVPPSAWKLIVRRYTLSRRYPSRETSPRTSPGFLMRGGGSERRADPASRHAFGRPRRKRSMKLNERFPPEFLQIVTHFYRGEVQRSTDWRTRLDATTNWAIIAMTATCSWALTHVQERHGSHIIFFFTSWVVFLLMCIEARRYRHFDVWRTRV